MTRKAVAWWSLFAVAGIAAIAAYELVALQRQDASLITRMAQIIQVENHTEVPCAGVVAAHPLVLLAIGQSNAENHGSPPSGTAAPVTLIGEGKCISATAPAPLPGGTGTGDNIWQRLPALLSTQKEASPIVLSVLAVDATSIANWTSPHSPLHERLAAHVASMHRLGLAPDLILWQQGEADARRGTSANEYAAGLGQLAAVLNEAGANAPIILARSTVCRSSPSAALRSAVEATVASDRRFRLGPDTDALSGDTFRNGCHLTAEGLDSAAKMWARVISAETLTIWPVR